MIWSIYRQYALQSSQTITCVNVVLVFDISEMSDTNFLIAWEDLIIVITGDCVYSTKCFLDIFPFNH